MREYTAEQLARMNDAARMSMIIHKTNVLVDKIMCRFVLTSTVADLPIDKLETLLHEVGKFNSFTPENDPHGEHDFGKVELDGNRYFFKFDYYDASIRAFGHENHVMTIMAASDY
jgi:hypothetical protein